MYQAIPILTTTKYKMDQKKFLKDILRIRNHAQKSNPSVKGKIDDFTKGVTEGMAQSLPEEERAHFEKIFGTMSPEQCIEQLMQIPDLDLVSLMDEVFSAASKSGKIDHEGMEFDLNILGERYKEMREQFKKYEGSEDINNF